MNDIILRWALSDEEKAAARQFADARRASLKVESPLAETPTKGGKPMAMGFPSAPTRRTPAKDTAASKAPGLILSDLSKGRSESFSGTGSDVSSEWSQESYSIDWSDSVETSGTTMAHKKVEETPPKSNPPNDGWGVQSAPGAFQSPRPW